MFRVVVKPQFRICQFCLVRERDLNAEYALLVTVPAAVGIHRPIQSEGTCYVRTARGASLRKGTGAACTFDVISRVQINYLFLCPSYMSDDWRSTLFCWTGTLSSPNINNDFTQPITYSGSWLPSTNPLDSSDPLHATSNNPPTVPPSTNLNTFTLATTLAASHADFRVYAPFKGSYMLDNGDGHDSYRDKKHVLIVKRIGGNGGDGGNGGGDVSLAAARGNTEFGKFVSVGYVAGDVLTLVRRYVDDGDLRVSSKWSDEDYLVHVLKKMNEAIKSENFAGGNIGLFIEKQLPLEQPEDAKTLKDYVVKGALEGAERPTVNAKGKKKRKAK